MLAAIICSPPYGDAVGSPSLGSVNKDAWGKDGRDIVTRRGLSADYGTAVGQLGGLPVGDLQAILCSPPYAETMANHAGGGSKHDEPQGAGGRKNGAGTHYAGPLPKRAYGTTPGQLGSLKPGTAPEGSPMTAEQLTWPMSECYGEGWGDLIVPEAYAHPAKFSRMLIFRIVRFMLERGMVEKNGLVGDPFGGVALGGIACAYGGLRWLGVELEPRFAALAQQNIELHRRELGILGCPLPVLVQGDSREFSRIVGQVAAICTSPPYAATNNQGGDQATHPGMKWKHGERTDRGKVDRDNFKGTDYGHTEGQVGALPCGSVEAVVTSPPFSQPGSQPPPMRAHAPVRAKWAEEPDRQDNYGTTEGQVGKESGGTYWEAMRDIYAQCLTALKPGGVLACVAKGYVSKGKLVDLPAQTAALLEHLGFVIEVEVHAMLTSEVEVPDLFGGTVKDGTSRKSFFRRLCEKKGSPAIDYETVLMARKPPGEGGGSVDAAVTSPPYAESIHEAGNKKIQAERPGWSCGQIHTSGEGYGTTPGQVGSLKPGSLSDILPE